MIGTLKDVAIETILETSFKDFHAKGFDYICLRRSPKETVKLYFFADDVSALPEVIHPHDHRYSFWTDCISGSVQNVMYWETRDGGEPVECFDYRTPLLGGNGFTWNRSCRLKEFASARYRRGQFYIMGHQEIHTIRIMEPETVLCITQYEDVVTTEPTRTYARDREPPSLNGLYNRFTADDVVARLAWIRERAPWFVLPKVV